MRHHQHFATTTSHQQQQNADDEADDADGKKKKKTDKKPKKSDGDLSKKTFRLDRLLANRGVGSRVEVTQLIRRGKVRTQDGQQVK